ncbi:hypothetical protein BKA14_002599 [Actinoplanes abujensis]|uniref:Uncharacterized protein n=1 Tax=Paractinoplanes abujensis TaxID=882441 RepID=A0A7W7CT31_9ACTN|nr:hypothetical protein [Actinoplanes abujensis]
MACFDQRKYKITRSYHSAWDKRTSLMLVVICRGRGSVLAGEGATLSAPK